MLLSILEKDITVKKYAILAVLPNQTIIFCASSLFWKDWKNCLFLPRTLSMPVIIPEKVLSLHSNIF